MRVEEEFKFEVATDVLTPEGKGHITDWSLRSHGKYYEVLMMDGTYRWFREFELKGSEE